MTEPCIYQKSFLCGNSKPDEKTCLFCIAVNFHNQVVNLALTLTPHIQLPLNQARKLFEAMNAVVEMDEQMHGWIEAYAQNVPEIMKTKNAMQAQIKRLFGSEAHEYIR